MKNRHFIVVMMASVMLFATSAVSAQEQDGFKKIDVRKDFTENGLQWFRDADCWHPVHVHRRGGECFSAAEIEEDKGR